MKKTLTALLLAVTCGVFAAFQYDIVTTPYTNSNNEGKAGSYYKVTVTSGIGTFYITDKINTLWSASSEALSNVMSGYGYVKADGTLVNGTNDTITVKPYQGNAFNGPNYQYGYELGTFKAGDSFGIWVANNSGTVGTSTPTKDFYSGDYGKLTDVAGTTLAELDYRDSSAIFFGITAYEKGSPNGQPLPGFLATLLIGGCSLVGLRKFSFRAKKA